MDMIRNPTMFNEMMRNHDQAIRNLQGIPGGEAALQRLYQDVQEPLLNSTVGSLGGNPFASSNTNDQDGTSRSQRAGVENAEALPNPWSSGGQQNPTGGNEQNSLGSLFGNLGGGNLFSPQLLNVSFFKLFNHYLYLFRPLALTVMLRIYSRMSIQPLF
jgi:ubiquilin